MPIYEFICPSCGQELATICSVGQSSRCPTCSTKMERTLSLTTIRLGGTKIRTRVALDDKLQSEGMKTKLFSSPERKDYCSWVLRKEGIK